MKKIIIFSFIAMFTISVFAEEETNLDTTTTTRTEDVVYNQGDVSLEAGVDIVSQYFFRGIKIENQDLIVQPYATINFAIISGCDFELTLFAGIWASLHREDLENVNADDPELLNEMDFSFGAIMDFYDLLSITTAYTINTFPNAINAGEDVHEVNVTLTFNDGELTNSNFTINPFLFYVYELHDSNPNGVSNFADESAFFQFGIKPTLEINILPDVDMAFALPVVVGLAANNNAYVDNNNNGHYYGYTSVGLEWTMPLVFIPKRLGEWEFVAEVDALFLSEALEDINDDDEIDFIEKFGIHMTY